MKLIYYFTPCECAHDYCVHAECGSEHSLWGCLSDGCECTKFVRVDSEE